MTNGDMHLVLICYITNMNHSFIVLFVIVGKAEIEISSEATLKVLSLTLANLHP